MFKLSILLFPALLLAQSTPSFDVATVKPSDALKNTGMSSGWSISVSDNGLHIHGTFQTLIKYAYGVEDVQLSGGPAWLNRDMYEINGKAAAAHVELPELKRMLQTLLTERFRLATHKETRQLPVYSMIVAKGGSKLQRPPDDGTSSSSGATFLRGTMDTASLAAHLTSILQRTVLDGTALQGTWKFNLTWPADDSTSVPPLFTAIQEQLGLKLESAKGPVQVLVIDSAERPSEN